MKIAVLGHNGMLGRYVSRYLSARGIACFGRNDFNIKNYESVQIISETYDLIINCIGVIKPRMNEVGMDNAIYTNSIFPHLMANECEKNKNTFIHITTDCVFDGRRGRYTENDAHNAEDAYGKSKSLGEPNNCMTIRTSIIGEEISNSRSLVEWVKSKKNDSVQGYVNHFWNGVTCLQLAKYIESEIDSGSKWKGVRHIFSPNDVSKYELVKMISDIYGLNIAVSPHIAGVYCDRTLRTTFPVNTNQVKIPDLYCQISEMKEFKLCEDMK